MFFFLRGSPFLDFHPRFFFASSSIRKWFGSRLSCWTVFIYASCLPETSPPVQFPFSHLVEKTLAIRLLIVCFFSLRQVLLASGNSSFFSVFVPPPFCLLLSISFCFLLPVEACFPFQQSPFFFGFPCAHHVYWSLFLSF